MNTTEELIADIKAGKMIILMDDEDRENEGDLIVAAECIQEQHINFMAQYGRGLICLPMSKERCRTLQLPLMVPDKNHSKFGTNFTVSIEAAQGVTTGISVPDRTHTIRVASSRDAKAQDVVQPGHIFPIMAQEGGVLVRAGHTEASCDFAVLAGFNPVAVLCEILNEDGSMARGADLKVFAQKHGLKIGTIADLIRYRLDQEKTVYEKVRAPLETQWGSFELVAFESAHDQAVHFALTFDSKSDSSHPAMIRIQALDPIFDLPGLLQGHFEQGNPRWPLQAAMAEIASSGKGAIVLLAVQKGSNAADLFEEIGMMNKKQEPSAPSKASLQDWRTIGVGSQILSQLGFSKLRVLGGEKKFHGLSGFGLEVIDYLPYPCKYSNLNQH